jgi:hypothetical protein
MSICAYRVSSYTIIPLDLKNTFFIFHCNPYKIAEVTSATSEPPDTITVTKQENRGFGGSGGKFTYVKV